MERNGISRGQLAVMAVAAGVSVANLYYSQPILAEIASSFNLSGSQVGHLPSLTQIGYGIGLLTITPLGDIMERKRLVLILQALLILSLVGVATAGSLAVLSVLSLVVGILSVSTQVILPMAASLAKEKKGGSVGVVFTGVLIGILAARVFSGFVGQWLSWRWVYGLSAIMMTIAMIMVGIGLPSVPPTYSSGYGALLSSTLAQLRRFSSLRRAALIAALMFGTFCSFWTTLTFRLSVPPFNFRSDVIGLFGLVGIAGALGAPVLGRLADKRSPAQVRLMTIGLVLVALVLVQIRPLSLVAVMIATLFLDFGVQATQIINLAQIYALDEAAHSRVNTMFMTIQFIGGAIGTQIGVMCWNRGGLGAVGWQLTLGAALAMMVALGSVRFAGARSHT